jgi:uncharacterized FAD-dependent dehydrogenase
VCDTIKHAISAFSRRLKGFDLQDAVLTGVETRSSCPVRLVRGKDFQASISGLYPAGEGGGYAGGIMSSAVDSHHLLGPSSHAFFSSEVSDYLGRFNSRPNRCC